MAMVMEVGIPDRGEKKKKTRLPELETYARKVDNQLLRHLIEVPPHGYADEHANRDTDWLLQILHEALVGHLVKSEPSIMIASQGILKHPRDFEDAARIAHVSRTPYSVWSSRTYFRNFEDTGHIPEKISGPENLAEELRFLPFQMRVLNTWIGDQNGQPEKTQELERLLKAQIQMERDLRQSFMAIDKRPEALQALRANAGYIDRLPAESLILDLEQVTNPREWLQHQGRDMEATFRVYATLRFDWTVGGSVTLTQTTRDEDNVPRLVRGLDLTNAQGTDAIKVLPYYLGMAAKYEQKKSIV